MNWEEFCQEMFCYGYEVGLTKEDIVKAIRENEELLSWIFKK
ncbi:hypothetical protein [Bacillus cytotoxicus]|nr:hypothetical protein [Bacillus cytotoxicus]